MSALKEMRMLIFGCALLIVGISFKLFHQPGSGLMILVSAPCFLIHSIFYAVKNRSEKVSALSWFAFTFWMVYIIFRIQYYPWSIYLLYAASILTIVSVILISIRKEKIKLPQIMLSAACIIGLWICTLHTYEIFRGINLNTTFNQDDAVSHYEGWDKYSWFLYVAGEHQQAMDANKKALEGVIIAMNNPDDFYAASYYEVVLRHQLELQSGTWTQWP